MQVPIAHKTHGFSPTEGFLDSSISPDIFLRKRLCMDFSSIFLSLSPWGALHLAWVAAILVIWRSMAFLNKFEQVWSKAKERSQKQAYWLQSTIRDQLLARLATSCCLELFGRQGALLSALASLVLLQPPVLTSTDVFLRLRYIAAHGDCSTIFSQRLSK